ncbi:alcohol dehydrogenase catalytic domain-containing protein [Halocatena pleomorpha]|uniref:Alcohol dehydrogenase n=1 Tax=Halocatena pleomorpha TaxID=1785090 RepID=A0A3P3RD99_9EURY|nr:alcohol dehydrogenase catalytic domain-containing protein [Halocatena pleomorpha]RRJ31462.1 alcohol dehydrogenase [Halocatena pleomorpha]
MNVAAFTGFGGPEDVAVREIDTPGPGNGEAMIDVHACAINRHDLWILEGDSAMVGSEELPFVTGLDVAGVVRTVGDGVKSVSAGDRVVLCPNQTCGVCRFCRDGPENLCEQFSLFHGGLAEHAVVNADRLVTLPESVETTAVAAVPTAYMTALHMLRRADVGPGDLVLIPGATGGVGVAATQLVDAVGARSIGTSTSAAKLDRLSGIGADFTIKGNDTETIGDAVANIGAPDAVLNHLGGEYTEMGLSVLRRGGRMVICGRTAGGRSEIDIPELFLDHKHVIGSTMGTQKDLQTLVQLLADATFEPVIDDEYELSDTDQAFADMQNRDIFGKLVVHP